MGLHGLKNKTSKNSFDLSHRNLFTAKVGELIPCSVFELNPGDTINLDTSYFTRTAPLDSAAYTRLRENVQFFFVPYSQLWKYFDSQVMNMTSTPNGADISRVATGLTSNSKITTQMPFVQYKALHEELTALANAGIDSLDTYNYIKDNLFNNGEYRWSCSAKLLQMLGYGNFPEQNFSVAKGQSKYTLDTYGNVDSSPSNYFNVNLSIFRLLAYHKVCNDHYTYRQWQPYNAYLCNVDYLVPDKSGSLDISSLLPWKNNLSGKDNLTLLDMRFSNLPLDYFNGVLPTPQFGSESVVNLNLGNASGSASVHGATSLGTFDSNYYQSVFDKDGKIVSTSGNLQVNSGALRLSDDSSTPIYVKTGINHTHSFSGSATIDTSLSGNLSIAALRQATALQKYKEIQLANDSDFVSQIEAHFGVTPKHSDTVSYFLGGASSMIDINPQVNSNLADWSQSNAIKAAPLGQGHGKIKFTADTYGIVLGIYRCVPVLDYAHVGVDRTLFKTDASDFVIPELDSIGMQQSVVGEICMPSYHDGDNGISSSGTTHRPTDSFGYAPRYAEYKTSFDRFNGEFCYSLSNWVTGLDLSRLRDLLRDSNLPATLAPELFNCRPDLVKSIFLNQKTLLTRDDNLFVGLVNMAYVIRRLSRYGLPYSG
uniref:Major capsid protein n=1 Tax=Microviridae sp. ct3hs7 TaxID=2824985 RepID=A0A8S5R288_9VIRU|nr:MAG TPA: Major capsid protein [Microviridae sp. ct3hs7]